MLVCRYGKLQRCSNGSTSHPLILVLALKVAPELEIAVRGVDELREEALPTTAQSDLAGGIGSRSSFAIIWRDLFCLLIEPWRLFLSPFGRTRIVLILDNHITSV